MKEHEYFVYIVCSNSGTLYIGMTNSIYRRALEHKRGEIEGFAAKYGCTRLVYYESFDDVGNAIDREKQLKGWRRERKIALIEAMNPRWQDLPRRGEHKWRLRASQSRTNNMSFVDFGGRGFKLQFQVKGRDYFLTFVEDERRWYVFAPTPQGMHRIPVYVDTIKWERIGLLEPKQEASNS